MKRKISSQIVAGITVIIVYVLLSATGMMKFVADGVGVIVRPVADWFSLSGRTIASLFIDPVSLAEEREEIDRDAALLAQKELSNARYVQENEELLKLLDFKTKSALATVQARVIGFDVTENARAIIDQGSTAGIRSGMAVLAYEGILIGRIGEVAKEWSLVSLLQERGTSVAVTFAGQESIEAILQAQAGGLTIELLPQHASITPGTLVTSAGIDARIPQGLIIGRLGDISQDRTLPYARATVEPVVPYRRIRFVSVYAAE